MVSTELKQAFWKNEDKQDKFRSEVSIAAAR
jgi:hypothetical protein